VGPRALHERTVPRSFADHHTYSVPIHIQLQLRLTSRMAEVAVLRSSRLAPHAWSLKSAIKEHNKLGRASVQGDMAQLHVLATHHLLQVNALLYPPYLPIPTNRADLSSHEPTSPPKHAKAVHYQPGVTMGAVAGTPLSIMFTSPSLMQQVTKYGHFVVTDGKNDSNSAGSILSSFSLRTQEGSPYAAFLWIGEVETEQTIYNAGKVFSNLVPCSDPQCKHPWHTAVRPDGGFTVCCPCSVNSTFSPASSTDKFWGSINALTRLGWEPVSLCDFHAFEAIDKHLRNKV